MLACDLVSVELRLDRIEAELVSELPPHMRAFARAHARNEPAPPAPEVVQRPSTLAAARASLAHPLLVDRGLALLRLVAPLAIERDAAVAAARAATPSWDAYAALSAARDGASRTLFGIDARDLTHRLHGTAFVPHEVAASAAGVPPPVDGWRDPDGAALDARGISQLWDALRVRHGVSGAVRFERSADAHPRTFVVLPRGEVVVVVPAHIATPADRFAVLHELGHVLVALALPAGMPRVVDEAAAAYLARTMEATLPSAAAARARRLALAAVLDAHECALPDARIAERPPWALWHDPFAQAAYIAAESLADALVAALGPSPAPGALVAALAAQRAAIDAVDLGV